MLIKSVNKPSRMAKEKEIELLLCQWLQLNGYYVFKLKDQMAFRNGSYRKPRPFEISGVADLFAIKNGAQYWIEVKSQKGTQSANQKDFQQNIEAHGGKYLLVKSIQELILKLEP
jgi:hypothetical protein